jgi:hypothetical protein
MNSYQMVLHRPVETARVFSKFILYKVVVSQNPVLGDSQAIDLSRAFLEAIEVPPLASHGNLQSF